MEILEPNMPKQGEKVVIDSKRDILEKQLRRLVTHLIPEANYEKIRKEEVEKVNSRCISSLSYFAIISIIC